MEKIDLENHFYDESLIDALKTRNEPPLCSKDNKLIRWTKTIEMPQDNLLPALLESLDESKEKMDKFGITTMVLSSAAGHELLDVKSSIAVCHKTNRLLYEITKKFPGYYLGSAVLPVKDVEAACEELERCVKEYGFVSWHTHSNYGDTFPNDERYRPIFKKAAELGVYGRLLSIRFSDGFSANSSEYLCMYLSTSGSLFRYGFDIFEIITPSAILILLSRVK